MAADRDFDDEIQHHIDLLTERLIAQGTPPEEARYAARRQFGNTVSLKETRTEMRPFIFVETFWQDLRHGARSLRKNKGFTAVAVLTLALGVGANTALFTVVDSVLLRPLPFPHSERLFSVGFYPDNPSMPFIEGTMYDGDYAEYAGENRSFGTIANYGERGFNMTGAGAASHVRGLQVTSQFFSTLGVSPFLGRVFLPEERDGVVILSDSLWRSRFASGPAVLERAGIILARLDGKEIQQVARELRISVPTVMKWCRRFSLSNNRLRPACRTGMGRRRQRDSDPAYMQCGVSCAAKASICSGSAAGA